MSAGDSLALALSEWQRKHHIADDDPMIAVLELIRLALRHPAKADDPAPVLPSFEEFRGTMELLDSRSKAFVNQAADVIAELRRFAHNVQRLNDSRTDTLILLMAVSLVGGIGIGWLLWG